MNINCSGSLAVSVPRLSDIQMSWVMSDSDSDKDLFNKDFVLSLQ